MDFFNCLLICSKPNAEICVPLHSVRLCHSIGRVVYRGYNNANANGGVSNANANNDASNTNTNVGSRLDNYQSAYITGDVSPSRAESDRPRQQHSSEWKAGTSSVG